MATWKTEGFVLKRVPWKEYDGLYTLYTRDNGKIVVRAHGIRKITSKLAGHCEPFMQSHFFLAEGKHWDTLAGSQVQQSYSQLRNSFQHLVTAQALTRTLDIVVHESQPDIRIYELLENAINFLNANEKSAGALWFFSYAWRWKLIAHLGYAPELNHCIVQKHTLQGQRLIDIQHGGIVCQEHVRGKNAFVISSKILSLLEKTQTQSFEAIQNEKATKKEWQVFGHIIDQFVDYHSPKPIKNIFLQNLI